MDIKAAAVAYVFSVQYFENATIVAYESLRVKCLDTCMPTYATLKFIIESHCLVTYVQLF